ncbi:hypothetical protein P9477_14625 [Enterobacter mori]|uniref:hypothetical protein n=1 Tax=Enterobacter mori TaxID=539813 RepID=UPI00398B631C
MATNTNLKTTINFGARIDSSFTGATGSLNKALKGIGTETARNRALQTAWGQQMARSLGGAAGETEKLTRAQDTLKKSIQEATLAGKDTVRLKKRYAEVSKELEKATRVQNRLTEAMKREIDVAERAEKVEQRRARMRNSLRAGSSMVLHGSGHVVGAAGTGLMTIGKWASAGLAAGATAAIASPIMLNAKTGEELGQARGYGMRIEKYKAGGTLAEQFGLTAENYGDLSEEGTNKIWEEGNEKTLNPMLKQLGLTKGVLQKMGREKAFDLLMQKLSTMKDGAAAASLADQLMGGEANKLLTGLHDAGKAYNQAMEEAKRYNLLTQEGAEGAMQANIAVNRLWGVAESGMQDTVGKITRELVPSVDDASVGLAKWIKDIQPLITGAVIDWIKPDDNGKTGPQRLWDGMVKLGQGVETVADVVMAVAGRLKWLIPDKDAHRKEMLRQLSMGDTDAARDVAKENNDIEWLNKVLASPEKVAGLKKQRSDAQWSWSGKRLTDPGKYWDNVYTNMLKSVEGPFGKDKPSADNIRADKPSADTISADKSSADTLSDKTISAVPFRSHSQQNYNDHRNINITVNAAPGQSTEKVGQSVYDAFLQSLPKGWEPSSGNNAFDMPSV